MSIIDTYWSTMGAATIAGRLLKNLGKKFWSEAPESLTKTLSAQAGDITKAAGAKMSPEQTEKALEVLKLLGPTEESRRVRQGLVEELLNSGVLKDPLTERAYAVGSITTGKEIPSDFDVLLRSSPSVSPQYRRNIGDVGSISEFSNMHFIWPHGQETGPFNVNRIRPGDVTNEMKKSAYRVAETGQGKYGPGHKWIRLLGAAAVPGGGWPEFEKQK